MHFGVMRSVRLTSPLRAGMTLMVVPALLYAGEAAPTAEVARLSAEDFRARVAAEQALREWSARQPDGGKRWLLDQMRKSAEPEGRNRLRSVLRDRLAEEAMARAPGYVGIRMNEALATLPGEAAAQPAVQVGGVVADAPAQKAGLQVGDRIVSIDGQDFAAGPAVTLFSATVAGKKPGTRITLEVVRAVTGKLEKIPVVLGGRPLSFQAMAPLTFPGAGGPPVDPVAEEAAARERLLRDWLKKQPPAPAVP